MSGDWVMDGGGSVAADSEGRVFVFYHGGKGTGEEGRRVLVRISEDEGRTFDSEKVISPEGFGVCACCAMQSFADTRGRLFVIYRMAADGGKQRDVAGLVSTDHGRTWKHASIDPWRIAACPMSSMSIAEASNRVLMAWEREGQIYAGFWNDEKGAVEDRIAMPGQPAGRKHPVLMGAAGGTLFAAWTEGTGWNRGGSIGWQRLDKDLQSVGPLGHAPGGECLEHGGHRS